MYIFKYFFSKHYVLSFYVLLKITFIILMFNLLHFKSLRFVYLDLWCNTNVKRTFKWDCTRNIYLHLFFWIFEKRFYNRETIPIIRISSLSQSLSTLSWLVEILELIRGLIILVPLNGTGVRHLLYFIIQYHNCFSIIKSLLTFAI